MQRSFITIALCFLSISILGLPASAKAEFFRVTPATEHQSTFAMIITAQRHAGTTLFTVLIQARHGYTLSIFHHAYVNDYEKHVKFDRWQTPNADPKSSRGIVSTSNRGSLHYQFAVPNSQLSSTVFTYESEGYTLDHGKIRRMPSADFQWFRCRDFAWR